MTALRNKVLGATLALGTTFGSIATPVAAEQDNTKMPALQTYETVDRETAKARSAGGVTLHFGEGFPEIAVQALTNILTDRTFKVEAFKGGVENKITVCLDNACWNEDFNLRDSGQILFLVSDYGQHLVSVELPSTTLE